MWLARYFPGLPGLAGRPLGRMTPEECRSLAEAGRELLKNEADERLMHTKVIAASGGMRLG
jgi:hypothetical protein